MFKGFKAFISRGNVVDLAVGVIIGGAFGKIVSSLVNDIIMPPIGLLLGGVDFANQFLVLRGGTYATLKDAKADKNAVILSYGTFINTIVEFLIIAIAVYILVEQVSRFMPKPPEPAPAAPMKDCPQCTMSIPAAALRCPHCTSPVA